MSCSLSKQDKRAIFMIFSNESTAPTSPLHKATNTTMLYKSAIEDLCLMSKCNFLIGPPSSFSSQASTIGKVPLLYIEDSPSNLVYNKFRLIWTKFRAYKFPLRSGENLHLKVIKFLVNLFINCQRLNSSSTIWQY